MNGSFNAKSSSPSSFRMVDPMTVSGDFPNHARYALFANRQCMALSQYATIAGTASITPVRKRSRSVTSISGSGELSGMTYASFDGIRAFTLSLAFGLNPMQGPTISLISGREQAANGPSQVLDKSFYRPCRSGAVPSDG